MFDITEILNSVKNNENSALFYTPIKKGDEKCYLFKTPTESVVCDNPLNIEDTLQDLNQILKNH